MHCKHFFFSHFSCIPTWFWFQTSKLCIISSCIISDEHSLSILKCHESYVLLRSFGTLQVFLIASTFLFCHFSFIPAVNFVIVTSTHYFQHQLSVEYALSPSIWKS
jgi:hypothetical protein